MPATWTASRHGLRRCRLGWPRAGRPRAARRSLHPPPQARVRASVPSSRSCRHPCNSPRPTLTKHAVGRMRANCSRLKRRTVAGVSGAAFTTTSASRSKSSSRSCLRIRCRTLSDPPPRRNATRVECRNRWGAPARRRPAGPGASRTDAPCCASSAARRGSGTPGPRPPGSPAAGDGTRTVAPPAVRAPSCQPCATSTAGVGRSGEHPQDPHFQIQVA